MASMMRPMGQEFLGADSSTTSTTSPMAKFLRVLFHFFLSCNIGRYSFTHLFQNRSTMYWTCYHHLWTYRLSFLNNPGGRMGLPFSWSKWFGVKASISLGSLEEGVIGRSFSIASTSRNTAMLHHLALVGLWQSITVFLLPAPSVPTHHHDGPRRAG